MLTKKKVELDLVGYGSQRCSLFTSCNPLKGAKVQLKIHVRARNFFFYLLVNQSQAPITGTIGRKEEGWNWLISHLCASVHITPWPENAIELFQLLVSQTAPMSSLRPSFPILQFSSQFHWGGLSLVAN